jgi:Tfp pilus assembly protein PilO
VRRLEKQQLVILTLAVVLFVGFGLCRYYPLAKQKKRIEKVNEQQIAAVAEAKTYSMQLPILRRHIKAMIEKTNDYDLKIPKNRHFAELWQQLASVMNEHNLKEQLVQPGSEIQSAEVNCIPINIECSGSLKQIFELFKSLNNFERLIRIESIRLINDKDFVKPLKMKVQASVYYRSTEEKSI